jgi:hypothetical protein
VNLPEPVTRAWERARDRISAFELPAPLQRVVDRVRRATDRVISFLQPIVVSVLLFFVYVIGIGLTRLVCAIGHRHVLKIDEAVESNGSFWRDAQGYEPDPVRLHKQL